jgi:hypothetical protein
VTNPDIIISDALPPNTSMRIGVAALDADGVTIIVRVAGQKIPCGFLDAPAAYTIGQPVAMLRCGATWLALGQVQAQP